MSDGARSGVVQQTRTVGDRAQIDIIRRPSGSRPLRQTDLTNRLGASCTQANAKHSPYVERIVGSDSEFLPIFQCIQLLMDVHLRRSTPPPTILRTWTRPELGRRDPGLPVHQSERRRHLRGFTITTRLAKTGSRYTSLQ